MRNFSKHIYRTKDGLHYFEFAYTQMSCPQGEYFEITILTQPSYGSRNDGNSICHRLTSKSMEGKMRVCITENKLIEATGTLDKARAVSIGWAEMTSKYILSGETIDQQVQKLHGSN